VGPLNWLVIFILTALIGGVIAVLFLLAKKRLRKTLHNVMGIFHSLMHGQAPYNENPELDVREPEAVGLPHAAVIALGTFAYLIVSAL
jgi:Flp pilus assembly protein protease CpaA